MKILSNIGQRTGPGDNRNAIIDEMRSKAKAGATMGG